jgi:lactoylglutathione lyase
MKYRNSLLVVRDLDRSIAFYREVLGLRVVGDLGANVTLTGGLCLQTLDTWVDFIDRPMDAIGFGNLAGEQYFEEDDFDAFLQRLAAIPGVEYLHPVKEHRWGQRAVRIYDPDRHIIEIGENMKTVCRRFLANGMTVEQTAVRMDVPEKLVRAWLR